MQLGELLTDLLISDLTVEGAGIARHDGRVLFVKDGLPGAVVSARVVGFRKGIAYAEQEQVQQPSPHARQPWCPHAHECGACALQHMTRQGELAWKQKHVRETLARLGKIQDLPVEDALTSSEERHRRNKMTFAFGTDMGEKGLQLGLRPRRDHDIVEVTECGMQRPESMRLLGLIRERATALGLTSWNSAGAEKAGTSQGYLRFLVVHAPDYSPDGKQQYVIECITGPGHKTKTGGGRLTNGEAIQCLGEELMRQFPLTGFIHSERGARSDLAQSEKEIMALGDTWYIEQFGALRLRVPYNAFLQTNTAATKLLYDRIAVEAKLSGSQILWDLYSGIGSIALLLAPTAHMVHGVESNADAVKAARQNANALGIEHCHFHCGEVTPRLLQTLPSPELVIVDPPRSGMTEGVIRELSAVAAPVLIYVSCDVGTQARDLLLLSSAYRPVKSIPVDMFPYSPHIENIVILHHL